MAGPGRKPGDKYHRKGGYGLSFMEVGESKTFPLEGSGKRNVRHLLRNVAVSGWTRKDMQFTVMSLPNGVYVRRLA